jgi:hypothetical protein
MIATKTNVVKLDFVAGCSDSNILPPSCGLGRSTQARITLRGRSMVPAAHAASMPPFCTRSRKVADPFRPILDAPLVIGSAIQLELSGCSFAG